MRNVRAAALAVLVVLGSSGPAQAAPHPTGPPGPPGHWRLAFRDDFTGTQLDASRWTAPDGNHLNGVVTSSLNVTVDDGTAILRLSDALTGGELCTCDTATGYGLPVGGFTEARVLFATSPLRDIVNWPAWWTSGPDWPNAGEHDIAEGLAGEMTVNYHSATGSHNQGAVPGLWGGTYHVFGLHRKPRAADVYYDGRKVKSYMTDDDGQRESLIANIGADDLPGGMLLGMDGQMRVDYVRAWERR
jgi:beta-glucanase (GH16 family)